MGILKFFVKIVTYLLIAQIWYNFIRYGYSSQNKIRKDESFIKRVGGQPPCQQICEEKYSYITGNTIPDIWSNYTNDAQAKNIAYKHIDEIADYYKNVSLNGLNFNQNDKSYIVSFTDVGCFFKQDHYYFQCFDTRYNSNQFRIIRNCLKNTLWGQLLQKIEQIKQQCNLGIQIVYYVFSIKYIIISLLLIAGILHLTVIQLRQYFSRPLKYEKDDDKFKYGLRIIDYCKEIQEKQIKQHSNRLNFSINKRIKDALQSNDGHKIKLITQSTQGIGITTNIEAWCQQTAYKQQKQVIHYNLRSNRQQGTNNQDQSFIKCNKSSNIDNIKLCQTNHLQNLQSMFFAISKKNKKLLRYKFATQLRIEKIVQKIDLKIIQLIINKVGLLGFRLLQKLFKVSQQTLTGLAIIHLLFQGPSFTISLVIFVALVSRQNIVKFVNKTIEKFLLLFEKDKDQGEKRIVQKDSNNKIIIIEQIDAVTKIQNYEKLLLQLLQKIQIVQSNRSYDVILVSKNRQFSEYLIEAVKRQKKKKNQKVQFSHRLIYPLSFIQTYPILMEKTVKQYSQKAKILSFFTNSSRLLAQNLKPLELEKFTQNMCIKKFHKILQTAKESLKKIKSIQELKNSFKTEQKSEEIKCQIDRIISVIRQHIKDYRLNKFKQDQLWNTLNQMYIKSDCQNDKIRNEMETVYRWYKYLEICSKRQASESLQQWLQDKKQIEIFKTSPFKKETFQEAIKYLNNKKILVNGNFSCISYMFCDKLSFQKEYVKIQQIEKLDLKLRKQDSDNSWFKTTICILLLLGRLGWMAFYSKDQINYYRRYYLTFKKAAYILSWVSLQSWLQYLIQFVFQETQSL